MVKIKVLPFAFSLILLMAIFGIVLYYKFLVLLKEKHFEIWEELGSPALFTNNSIKNNLRILGFLKNREYIEIKDVQLTKISQLLWNYSLTYLILFTIALFVFIIKLTKISL